jgi:hypothetical protein
MPPSNPTGQVYSASTTDFLVSGTSLTGGALNDAPAQFITVSEDGTIAEWGEFRDTPAQRMNGFEVVVDNSTPDENGVVAIYKGRDRQRRDRQRQPALLAHDGQATLW